MESRNETSPLLMSVPSWLGCHCWDMKSLKRPKCSFKSGMWCWKSSQALRRESLAWESSWLRSAESSRSLRQSLMELMALIFATTSSLTTEGSLMHLMMESRLSVKAIAFAAALFTSITDFDTSTTLDQRCLQGQTYPQDSKVQTRAASRTIWKAACKLHSTKVFHKALGRASVSRDFWRRALSSPKMPWSWWPIASGFWPHCQRCHASKAGCSKGTSASPAMASYRCHWCWPRSCPSNQSTMAQKHR